MQTEKRQICLTKSYKSIAAPTAPPISAIAGLPTLIGTATPLCRCGFPVPLTPAEPVGVVTEALMTAKLVIVLFCPFGNVVVSKTRLLTRPPPGVKVVTNVLPLASVVVTTWPLCTPESTTVFPSESVVVTSYNPLDAAGIAAPVYIGTAEVVVTPFETTTAPGTVAEVTMVEPCEFVVVTGTTTLAEATATAEVVEATTLPALSVLETTTGTTTAVEDEDTATTVSDVVVDPA